ncbi:MAG: HNH endonuclease signature motif containing protein, partial [Haloechinothrix sp.]
LDLGRTQRLVTPAQRRALNLRDRGCIHPGCTRPTRWTQAHHITERTKDQGPSDLSNMCLLCTEHHRLIHHSDWEIRMATDGHPNASHPPSSTRTEDPDATTPTTPSEPPPEAEYLRG